MKLTMATVGTRGDVQPFVVLGRALARHGFEVTIATHRDYESWIQREGMSFAPVGGSFKQLIESPEGRAWIESADSFFRYVKTTRRTFVPLLETWNRDMLAAAEDADAVAVHPFASIGAYVAEARNRPRVLLPLLPLAPSSRELEVVFAPRLPRVGPSRQWATEFVHRGVWSLSLPGHQRAREQLGLPPFRTKNPWNECLGPQFPVMNLWSEVLIPRPADYPPWCHIAGFMFDGPDAYEPPPELAAFLEAGPPPVYVGFGSMTGRDPATLARIVIDAVGRLGVRALLATGWGAMAAEELPDTVFPLGPVPHSWLFPRVAAVIHHGGAGTTAAGLRAGRPTLVTAFFGDQPFFGWRVHQVGAGPRPILRAALTRDRLVQGIEELLGEDRYRSRAAELGQRLQSERATERAAQWCERHLAGSRN